MSPTFADGTVRVTTPPSYAAAPARSIPGRTRGLPDPADQSAVGKDALVAALADSDLELVQTVDLTPRGTRDLGDKPQRRGTVRLDVDVRRNEDAVVLLERDGVYSWHLPADGGRHTRGISPGKQTRHFEIDVHPGQIKRRPKPSDRRDRGLLGQVVQGAAQALVFKFVAPAVVEKAVEKMEAHVTTGLVHLTAADVKAWKRFETLDELHLPTDRPVRILLFIHGTFSSTAGGFGSLTVGENGPGFLRTAISTYDAVIGYNHRTLSVDPKQNAEELLHRLVQHHPRAEFVIDIVTHSRGGLVTRSFVEQVLPQSRWPGRVDNIVFVAATNAGTHLADPKRWSDMVDIYTNLAAISAKVLTMAGAAPVAAVVGGVVKGIGAFVKYLVSYAAEGDEVPGLKAMVPGGAFVTDLNKMQPGQPQPGTNWFVVTSNFHVSLFDDSHNPPEFSKELVVKLKEGLVDQLFHGDNDLVVDTASMSAIGQPGQGFVRDAFALGKNDVVYHNNYFSQVKVIEAISGWLPLGLGAGGGEEAPRASDVRPPAVEDLLRRVDALPDVGGGGGAAPDLLESTQMVRERPLLQTATRARPPAPAVRGIELPQPRQAEPEPAPVAPAATTTANLAAEMPGHVVAKQDFLVRVRLARGEIVATAGAAHAEEQVEVDQTRPLGVQVVGKKNAQITGPDSDLFVLQPGSGISELQFHGQALAAGPLALTIVVRQGTVPISTMRLDAQAVATKDAADLPLGTTAEAAVHTGIDAPELEGVPCIDIYERELTNNRVSYQYAVRLEPGKPVLTFESAPLRDREKKIATILDDVKRAWSDTDAAPRERERRLQDIGAAMFDQLFPEDMQAYLWRKRAKVKDLIVYADEPFVPWELVHLKPPKGPREQQPRFLAQTGMVRWQPGSFPPAQMRVRRGRARTLVPDYKDPIFRLPEAVLEQQYVARKFHATTVPATPTGVRRLLRAGDFDLLHFSGHGAAHLDDILDAKLLLQGLKHARTVEPQYLGATTVSENSRWAKQGTPGPVVVLNACQVGQSGELLSTVGGFAKAFLDAGASAFVSCLWSVRDQPSRLFVEKLYDELLAGSPMSVATARARQAARQAGDATWLAFVVYARPDAVLVTS